MKTNHRRKTRAKTYPYKRRCQEARWVGFFKCDGSCVYCDSKRIHKIRKQEYAQVD